MFFIGEASQGAQGELYKLNGKKYKTHDLNDSSMQLIYEAERRHYESILKIVEKNLLDTYLNNLAKSSKKSRQQIESELFQVKVDDAAARHWFEANKARLGGRSFQDIKGDILNFLVGQKQAEEKEKLIKKIKKEEKFSFSLKAPTPPKLSINYDGYPYKGSKNAKVTIVEFADYLCPHCKVASKNLASVYEKYKDKIKVVYMDFPLRKEGPSMHIAHGGVCADKQNKFWEYHYMAFDNQSTASHSSPVQFAKKLKLDLDEFQKCMNAKSTLAKVDQARLEGERIGISGTPTIYINGVKINGYDSKAITDRIKELL